MKYHVSLYFLAIVVVGQVACGDSGTTESNDSTIQTTGDTSTPASGDVNTNGATNDILIAGLWDVTEEGDSGQPDVVYVRIAADGVVTEYDFQQDADGNGQNCVIVSSSTLTANGNDQYSQSDEIDGGFDTFTATKNGNQLTVFIVDIDDDNENGSTTDVIETTYFEIVGVDSDDFNVCSEPTNQTSQLDVQPSVEFMPTDEFTVLSTQPDASDVHSVGSVFAHNCLSFTIGPGSPGNEFSVQATNSCDFIVEYAFCLSSFGADTQPGCIGVPQVQPNDDLVSFAWSGNQIEAGQTIGITTWQPFNRFMAYGACGQLPSGRVPLVVLSQLSPAQYICRGS